MLDKVGSDTVCAVVVAYNRKEMLIKCLEALCNQTRPVDAIYVIDNASTDGTPQLLFDHNYIQALPSEDITETYERAFSILGETQDSMLTFNYVRMAENTGGAGGFHEGVKRAYESGYEWLWLMDDDVVPAANCLETLMKYQYISQCIHPRKIHTDGTSFNWYGRFYPRSGRLKPIREDSAWQENSYLEVNYGCFEGMLVSKEIVKAIGYPNQDYFICYDDRIYGWLASAQTKVIYVKDAIMTKLIKKSSSPTAFSAYYLVRNLFIMKDDLKRAGVSGYFHWFGYVVAFSIKLALKSIYNKKFEVVKSVFLSLVDGVLGRRGRKVL